MYVYVCMYIYIYMYFLRLERDRERFRCPETKAMALMEVNESHIQVGALEVGSIHSALARAPISPFFPYGSGKLPTCKLPSCSGL